MAGLGYAMKMVDDFGHETPRGVDAVGGNKTQDFIEISKPDRLRSGHSA
jgi:hypothetical protein